jgi:hypothetical protein
MFQTIPKFIHEYFSQLDAELRKTPGCELTRCQLIWFCICTMGILLTRTINWKAFERVSLGAYSQAALSKMCRHGKIAWNQLLICSARMILRTFKVRSGVLVIDDKDNKRSKRTRKIHGVHRMKDKTTGGYCMGQSIVMLYLVTPLFNLPVGFLFYRPDPILSEWIRRKKNSKGAENGDKLPAQPSRRKEYQKKYELALEMLRRFSSDFPEFKVTAILADALYGNRAFFRGASDLYPKSQIISQIRGNQIIRVGNRSMSVAKYFQSYSGWEHNIIVRGDQERTVIAGGARLWVHACHHKLLIVAIKHTQEEGYRYLVALDLSWNMTEVIETYTLRWLIEVFFEDWSCYCGFCQLAKQQDYEGSARPLILSLLFDHCMLMHPQQLFSLNKRLPLTTLGSIVRQTQADTFCQFISDILSDPDPAAAWHRLEGHVRRLFNDYRPSYKHMNGVNPTMNSKRNRSRAACESA